MHALLIFSRLVPQEIDCSAVLMAVDEFFRQLGLAEIRTRSARDDKPLRMVKTLLHELCKKKVALWHQSFLCRNSFPMVL